MSFSFYAPLIGLALCAAAFGHLAAVDEADRENLVVVCFGDSITGHRPGVPYQQHYVKFSDHLQLMLEARAGIGRATVHNAGYAGDSTMQRGDRPGAVNRYQSQIIDRQPHIAVILIGGNDGDRDREATASNLNQIFAACTDAGIKVLALQYPVMADNDNPGQAWVHLDDNNDLIGAAAEANGAEVLALQPAMDAAAEAAGGDTSHLVNQKDRVHLAPGGELVFARAIFQRLDELEWTP